jgi:PAS domain S-box-containing protein
MTKYKSFPYNGRIMKTPPSNQQPATSNQQPATSNQQPATMEAEAIRLLHELDVHQIELQLQNEELLRLKEQAEQEAKKYLELYDSSPSGYFTLSREGNILELNLAGAQMLGKIRSNLKNSKFSYFVSLATRPIFNLFIKNVFDNLVKETCMVKLSLGGDKRFDMSLTGLVSADGAHCFVTMVDISEHIQNLELLRDNKDLLFQNDENAKHAAELAAANKLISNQKNRLEEIASLVPGVVYQYRLYPDGSSCFPFASEAIEQIYHVTPDEVREDASKVFENLHPEDYDAVVSSIQTSAKNLTPWQHEYRVKFGDGTIRTLYGNAMPRLEADGSVLWHGFITDITERKQTENLLKENNSRLELATLMAKMAWWEMDVLTGTISYDQRKVEMLGYTSGNFDHYKGFTDLIHPDDHEKTMNAMRGHFSGLFKRYEVEYRILTQSGEYLWFYDFGSAVKWDDKGNPLYIVGYVIDITDRKLAEAKLYNSERFFNSVFNSQTSQIAILDKTGKVIQVNQKWRELANAYATIPDLVCEGANYLLVCDETTGPDAVHAKATAAGIRSVIDKSKTTFSNEYPCNTPTEEIWYNLTVTYMEGDEFAHILIVFDNISERKIAQESLRKSESRYSSMISNISDVIGIMGADGLMTYKSANIEKFFGWLPEERIGTSGFATVHPDDIPDVQNVFYSLLGEENSVKTFEFRYQCKDGSYKPIELTASNQMFNPAINGVLVNYRDISDRKTIEANLEESREKYRGLSEASFESIFLSEKGVCIEQNLAAELMFGYTTKEALTRYGTDWIVPENREMVMNNMISGYQEPYEATALRKDGSTFPCVLLGRMMQYKGRDVRVTSLTDITIRKKAEAELKLLSTRLSLATFAGGIGIWEYDVVNNALLWDDRMFTLYGIEERDFSGVYEAWRARLHPDDVEQGDLEIQMAINGVKEFDTEFRVIWPDQSVHSIKALAIVILDKSGKALHMVGTNWDITEQKNAEEELSKARNEAEFSNKAKSQFLANMSHEIRTPLNSIIGFSQLMNRQNLTEIQQEYSNSIHRSGEHLLILLNDILELSKIEAGQMELIQTRVDLTVLFSDLQLMFNQLAKSKQLKLTFERGDEFSQHVLVDETKIRQILINLIGNAIKFTEAGSVVVRARVSKTTDQKLLLVMEVLDSGPGIPESDLERIFKQFEQAKAGIKQGVGTGLGLALSRELAILMGGNITVTSEVGKGSAFTFRVEVEEGKPEYAMQEIKGRIIGMINPQQVYRILVVDDNEVNIAVMVNFLQLVGFETCVAVNGEDAIAKFEQWSPHLILMDLTMPVMDGYEATHRIKSTEQGKRTPVIAVTANQHKDNMDYARQLDFQAYIKKPFREDELFGVIGEILGITYIYEQEKGAAQLSRYINDPEALAEDVAKLPANNVVQMQEALEKADFYLLIELTRKIDATNPELAQYLRAQANNFDFDNFMKILKK